MKIVLMKFLDRILGAMAVRCLTTPAARPVPELRRVLFIRPGGIGDAVLLVPTLLALKKAFPDARITLLAEKRNGAIFGLCPSVDRVLLYDRPADFWAALTGEYDAVIDTEQWHFLSAVVARLIRAPFSVGFASNRRREMFSHAVEYSVDAYEVSNFLSLLTPLGISNGKVPLPYLTLPVPAMERAVHALGSRVHAPFIALFPGASIPEKRWGGDKFRRVVEELTRRGIPVVIVGGVADKREAEKIAADATVLNLAGKTSLTETAAVVARSALLISGDSGILHLAAGLDKPTVSLFGPSKQEKWAPVGEKHLVVSLRLPCSPCSMYGNTPPCPVGGRCIHDIAWAEVLQAVETLWLSCIPDAASTAGNPE